MEKDKILNFEKEKKIRPSLLFLFFTLGLLIRIFNIPNQNEDVRGYLKWYEYILQNGIAGALRDEFAIYTPPYLYLQSLTTLAYPLLEPLVAIKLIPIFFDIINTILLYSISKNIFQDEVRPQLIPVMFWVAPTIVINSSFWGQIDGLYVCFLLLTLLLILKQNTKWAMVSFGVAFSIKAQSIFLFPLLLVAFIKQKIKWWEFLLIPISYFAMMLPAIAFGRSINSLILAYFKQSKEFSEPSLNAANLYHFISESFYTTSLWAGLLVAGLIMVIWVVYYGKKRTSEWNSSLILMTALASVALMPFILPKMHDRYFYSADVLSILVAFAIPGVWVHAILFQVISTLCYLPFLLQGVNADIIVTIAAIINTINISFLLWKQWKFTIPHQSSKPEK